MLEQIPILGPSSGNSVLQINPQKSINLFPKIEQSGAKTLIGEYKTPGLNLISSTETGGTGRSEGVRWKAKEYFVIGSKLISIDDNNAITAVGTLGTTSGRCVIARGRSSLLVVDGVTGYTWDGTTFAAVADGDFPANPTHCIYIDGYFLVNETGTDNFYRSDFEDPTSWDPLLFEVASASPDNNLGLAVYDRDIYVPGEDTTQRYFNVGGVGFNYAPYPNTLQVGLAAPYSLAKSVYGITGLFNTENGGLAVVTLSGGGIQLESNDDDNDEIGSLATTSDAIGSMHTIKGLTFYSITFPAADVTKVFNIGKQMSHHRKSYGIGRWRVNGLGYTGKRILAVDYNNDNIYELDPNTYTENGATIECSRFTQIIHKGRLPFSCPLYEVECQTGVGLLAGQGSNPQLQLAVSRDGGNTYSEYRMKPLGLIGQYRQQTQWKQLGDFRQLNTEIKYTEPTAFAIIGGYADIKF